MGVTRGPVALVLALGLFASPLAAQPTDPADPQQLAKVEDLARRARIFYQEGRYDRAVALYLEAYRIAPAAATLYNVAHIYDRKLEEPDLATDFYRRYIRAPDADPKAVARATRRIGEIKAAQEASKLELPVPPIRVDPPPPVRQTARPMSRWKLAGWVAIGVGGAAVAGGAVFGTLANDKEARFHDIDETDRQALRDEGRAQALTADILFGVGIAAVATGVVLMVSDPTDDEGGFGLAPTDGGAAAWWRGRF